jgi:hypothetical protein
VAVPTLLNYSMACQKFVSLIGEGERVERKKERKEISSILM